MREMKRKNLPWVPFFLSLIVVTTAVLPFFLHLKIEEKRRDGEAVTNFQEKGFVTPPPSLLWALSFISST